MLFFAGPFLENCLVPVSADVGVEEFYTVVVMERSLLVLSWAPGLQQSGPLCSACSDDGGLVLGLKI